MQSTKSAEMTKINASLSSPANTPEGNKITDLQKKEDIANIIGMALVITGIALLVVGFIVGLTVGLPCLAIFAACVVAFCLAKVTGEITAHWEVNRIALQQTM